MTECIEIQPTETSGGHIIIHMQNARDDRPASYLFIVDTCFKTSQITTGMTCSIRRTNSTVVCT